MIFGRYVEAPAAAVSANGVATPAPPVPERAERPERPERVRAATAPPTVQTQP
jgi:hypothetical protein